MTQASSSRPTGARLEFVDACRALAVLGMLFANMMNVFLRRVPEVLSHNEGNRLRAFDFPAPVFQFLIGVSLVLFLERRGARTGSARGQAFRRFTLLIALGLVLDGVGALRAYPQWGVLQTLGLGGVAAAGLADLPDAAVAGCAFGLLGIFSGAANGEVHHSPLAAFAFIPLTLAGMLVGRGLARGNPRRVFVRRSVTVAIGGLVIAGVTHAVGVPFNKVLGTSAFVALATTLSALLLLAFAALERPGGRVFPSWFLAIGSNALMAWVLQYVLVYYPAWLVFPSWRRLHFLPGITATVCALVALSALTILLARRSIRIPI